jgi:hypothetical protein
LQPATLVDLAGGDVRKEDSRLRFASTQASACLPMIRIAITAAAFEAIAATPQLGDNRTP